MLVKRVREAVVLAVLAAALTGCNGEGEGGAAPARISGPPKEITDLIERFEQATAARDFDTVCDEIFAPELRRRVGGEACPDLLMRTARDVKDPTITVKDIVVKGEEATAKVTTTARGQAEAPDTIKLARRQGQYRITSLGS